MKNYTKNSLSADRLETLLDNYTLDPITASILVRRGLDTSENLKYFILQNNEATFNSPFCFNDMEVFVDRVKKAIDNHEKVYLFGDRDTDGITSLTIMNDYLQKCGLETYVNLPTGSENYGLALSVVDEVKEKACTLLITVDCGITAKESVDLFNQNGIDVLIVDHHLPPEKKEDLPSALAIIDPKLPDSGYPFDGLSAAGVVSKCVKALELSRHTQHYNVPYYLFTTELGKTRNSVILSLMIVKNLHEEERYIEEWALDGKNNPLDSEIMRLLTDGFGRVCVYKLDDMISLLSSTFLGELNLPRFMELRMRIVKYFPEYRRDSLFEIANKLNYHKMLSRGSALLDTFYYLFVNCLAKSLAGFQNTVRDCLDLAAISTIADLMPLTNENHNIVKVGLQLINNHPRLSLLPFLSQKALLMRPINSIDVSFYISPVINSAGRMGDSRLALDEIMSKDKEEIDVLSRRLFELNDERKKTGDEAWTVIKPLAEESIRKNSGKFVFVVSSEIPRGFTGLSASKALHVYNAPCVIISLQDDIASGSIRTPNNINALEFIQNFSDILSDFGAHQCAGGFTLDKNRIGELEEAMCERAAVLFDPSLLGEETLIVDAELDGETVSPSLLNVCDFFAPYGSGNPALIFLIHNLVVERADCFDCKGVLGLRLTLSNGRISFSAIGWSHGDKLNKDFVLGDKVKILTYVEKNYFRGNCTMQFNLIDIEREEA